MRPWVIVGFIDGGSGSANKDLVEEHRKVIKVSWVHLVARTK